MYMYILESGDLQTIYQNFALVQLSLWFWDVLAYTDFQTHHKFRWLSRIMMAI